MRWKGIVGQPFTAESFEDYVHTLKPGFFHPQFIVLHNTGAPTFAQWHSVSGFQRMKNLEHYYRDICKWSAGPHAFISDDYIWAFTPFTIPGVHSPSYNAISWGIEMVGDYETEPMNPAVLENTISALTTLHALANLDPSTLKLHKSDPKTTHTTCPGRHVDKKAIQDAIFTRLSTYHTGEHTF